MKGLICFAWRVHLEVLNFVTSKSATSLINIVLKIEVREWDWTRVINWIGCPLQSFQTRSDFIFTEIVSSSFVRWSFWCTFSTNKQWINSAYRQLLTSKQNGSSLWWLCVFFSTFFLDEIQTPEKFLSHNTQLQWPYTVYCNSNYKCMLNHSKNRNMKWNLLWQI